ncbi:hypothetical protein [Microbacterium sp. LWO13-1.2]
MTIGRDEDEPLDAETEQQLAEGMKPLDDALDDLQATFDKLG